MYGDWNEILNREDCVNYGIGGQTTKELVKRFDDITSKNYNTVVFLCGINDIGRGFSTEIIIENYKTMFNQLRESNADARIVVISVLPTTPAFYTDSQHLIVELDEALKSLVDQYDNAYFADAYSKFVQEDKYCNPEYVFDGLHPNETGYAVIGDVLKGYLAEEVAEEKPETSDEENNTTSDNQSKEQPKDNDTDNSKTGIALTGIGALAAISIGGIVISKKSKK
ncbi:MAG: hypothetical protein GX346_03285 [Clostridiales bacterium]|nr:hypothetical protein [Clostridiales bacterium]